jgi:hypothetical protein
VLKNGGKRGGERAIFKNEVKKIECGGTERQTKHYYLLIRGEKNTDMVGFPWIWQ